MGVKVITPPAQVIPTPDLVSHVRAPDDSEGPLLVAYLGAALGYAEHYTGRSFGSQTLELALDAFPAGAIDLPQGPVTAITSIKYRHWATNVETTLDPSAYSLDDYGLQCRVVPALNTEWPATDGSTNALKIRYVAGALPDAVRSALLLTVGHLFENRENTAPLSLQELPMGAKALLDTVKVWSF